ncbi:integrase domain-containing protein [Shewanella sp. TB4-MNA-CIBAN-0142]|uniref:integrase domain-containing protein n=1 Tax=Shewanella sp. TB4-MNA-CIBAN-0142 TaxID=3140464 RepID=UPI0033339183
MAKKVTPLTNTQVKQAKPKDKEYNLSDGEGLMLRVKPTGSKLWIFNYYHPFTNKRVNISFGSYPDLSLADAREKRVYSRKLLANDIDPKEERDTNKLTLSKIHADIFTLVAKDWYRLKANKVASKTGQKIWNSIENHLLGELGKHPITKINAPLVIDVLKPIAIKGNLELVRRLCQRMNEIMNYAVNVGLIHANPLVGIKAAFDAPKTTHLATIKPHELPEFMKTLSYASIKIVTRCLIEWQLNTLTRPSEAATAKWSEIDFDKQLWIIPADKMKMRREHIIPLTEQSLFLLERMKSISGHREYVFPANNDPKRHTNTETANMALKRMGYKNKLVSHGFRALASTTLNEQGFAPDVIEAALAHVDKNEVRRAYNRSDYLERRRVMMSWWSEHIEQARTGKIINSI